MRRNRHLSHCIEEPWEIVWSYSFFLCGKLAFGTKSFLFSRGALQTTVGCMLMAALVSMDNRAKSLAE